VLWAKEENSSKYQIGLDSSTIYRIGEISRIQCRKGKVLQGKTLTRIESNNPGCCGSQFSIGLSSPFDLIILEQNQLVIERPLILRDNCYDKGWFLRVEAIEKQDMRRGIQQGLERVSPGDVEKLKKLGNARLKVLGLLDHGKQNL